MATHSRPLDRGTERGRRIIVELGREVRDARRDRGLSQEAVGRALGISGVTVGRIERGSASATSVLRLACLLEVVGLELSARGYPGGQPLRDAAQVALLDRFRRCVHRSLGWRTEVPLPRPGDQRAWDALIVGDGWRIGVEAESAPRDAQALVRRLGLKARDGAVDGVVLVLPASRRARQFLASAEPTLAPAFPGIGSRTLELLRAGVRPPADSIVLV